MSELRSILAVVLFAASGAVLGQAKALPIALSGNDPVSYFTEARPLKGTSSINYDFDETRYLFSSARNKERFAADPDRYLPQFTGLCTVGLSMGMKAEADPSVYLVKDGKLYVFSSPQARDKAVTDPSLLAKAHQQWQRR